MTEFLAREFCSSSAAIYVWHWACVFALYPREWHISGGPVALGMVLPHSATGCVSPCCSLVLPVPFPAMYRVGPELLMPCGPLWTTFLPEMFCPLPLVHNPSACHILPFTLDHYPSPPLSQSSQHSLRQAPYKSKGSTQLGALLSPTLSLTVAHPFKTNLWAVSTLGSNVFFPSLSWDCTYDGTIHDQYHDPKMQTQVDSSATFQIPSFKGLICDPAVPWGDEEDDCLLGFSSSLTVIFLFS